MTAVAVLGPTAPAAGQLVRGSAEPAHLPATASPALPPGTIVNVAGNPNGASGSAGNGGPATSALLSRPLSVTVGQSGDVYVVDGWPNDWVRKIDASGTIRQFAGSGPGTSGNSGDGGPATAARFGLADAVAVDGAGNVYVADFSNRRVRKVDPSGVITNFAGRADGGAGNSGDGGPAAMAAMGHPVALATDRSGNVYIADQEDNRVRMVNTAGVISNFAGSPAGTGGDSGDGGPAAAALLHNLSALTVDDAGNVYIGQTTSMRKVSPDGTISNFAGSPDPDVWGDTGDGGPATAARLDSVNGVAVNDDGVVFFSTNARIRQVDAAGIMTTVAGTSAPDNSLGGVGDGGSASFASIDPLALAFDAGNNLYLADGGHNRVRMIIDPHPVPSAFTSATPTPTGSLWVDYSYVYAGSGFPAPTFSVVGGALPPGLTLDAVTGVLTGRPTAAGPYSFTVAATNTSGSVTAPATITIDPYPAPGIIIDFAGSPDGTPGNDGDAGPAIKAKLGAPTGLSTDSKGNVYIADTANNRIRRVDTTNGLMIFYAGNGTAGNDTGDWSGQPTYDGPIGVAADSTKQVYIADAANSRVRRAWFPGWAFTNFAGNPDRTPGNDGDGGPLYASTLGRPVGVAVDRFGDVYIADAGAGMSRVRKVDVERGVISDFAGSAAGVAGNAGDGGPATSATLATPWALAVDRAGNVYVADRTNHRVRKVDPDGVISNFAGSPTGVAGNSGDGGPASAATLGDPDGLAVDPAGNVYVADRAYNRVRKVDPDGVISNFAGSPTGVAGNSGDGGPASSARLSGPNGVAADSAGNVYVSDTNNARVRVIFGSRTPSALPDQRPPSAAAGTAYDFAFVARGTPAPTLSVASGALPDGLSLDAAGVLSGTPTTTGTFTFTLAAGNGVGATATSDVTLTVVAGRPPAMTGATTASFTVGVPGAFTVAASGVPDPAVNAIGALPDGVSYDPATRTFRGSAHPGTVGRYQVTLHATNGVEPSASQTVTLVVGDASSLNYPVGGQSDVDSTRPFAWSPVPGAQGYVLTVGSTAYGADLVNSGLLSSTKSTFKVPVLPVGPTLFATLFSSVGGLWSAQSVTFTAAPGQANMAYPADNEVDVDATREFAWPPVAGAQNWFLTVGTARYGTDVVAAVLPASRTHYPMSALPPGRTLYATMFTEVDGTWTRAQNLTFTTSGTATLISPVNNQLNVDPSRPLTWTATARAQAYLLVVGSKRYGTDVVSALLPAGQTSYSTAALPSGRTLYATLLTEIDGKWTRYHNVAFTTAGTATFTSPVNDQAGVYPPTPFTWAPAAGAQNYLLIVGTTPFGSDIVTAMLPPTKTSYPMPAVQAGRVLYATLFTRLDGTWDRYHCISFRT